MENQNVPDDACNLEISIRPEPQLEMSQDLELLAQEIAEAVVEEERRSSSNSSPTPSQSHMSDASAEVITETNELINAEKQEFDEEEDSAQGPDDAEGSEKKGRSQSPVDDEASWEIVDAEDDPAKVSGQLDQTTTTTRPARQNYSIVRKFLGSHDLWQKLKEIGMVCDICSSLDHSMDASDNCQANLNDMLVSCSESMVICDMPQDAQQTLEMGDEEEAQHQLPVREMLEGPKLPTWQGTIAGALVVVELQRLGGLLVASVKVNHTDLLSALASIQQLAALVGLVSYADVDVQSFLARAA